MEIHQFKTLKVSFRNVCLSEVLDENDSKCETFQARSLGITQIDKLQFSCIKIKKLDLSQNRIVHLSGLFQFPNLTNLNLSQNLIQSLTELLNIKNKSNLLFLQVNSNPFARHPNVLSLVVQLFPRLKKFDDVQVTDDLKQEIFD
jgi:Leucine-rich repeat (LRR) protein